MRTALLLLLLLALPCSALAEGFSGYAEVKGFAYGERFAGEPYGAGWGTLYGKWEQRLAEGQFTASLRAEWLTSPQTSPLVFDPADRKLRRPPLSAPELWLRVPLAPSHDLEFGRFQLGWGKTDGYSPADAFLPRDLTDPFADEKLPLWAIRLSGQEENLRYQAVLVPVTTPWRLPPLGSRNAPIASGALPAGTTFQEQDDAPPLPGFAALRLLATHGDWDLGVWARSGVRPAPILAFSLDPAMQTGPVPVISVGRRYPREHGVGVEVSRVAGPYVLRGEAAALFSADRELGDALIGTLSVERGFGDGTLLVTLAGNAIDPPVDPTLLFDRGLLPALIVAWNRTEEWGAWKLVWDCGLERGDGLVKAEVGYNVTDTWKVTVGGDLPYGSDQGPLGALHGARRVVAAVHRSW
ncbi:hypothetical protein KP001_14100 [Geomonas subterranea]|uniref:Uncharacterized protein n=1 Tax=Geomonas subterranea TaxID=2847989 RepID=A0ABX8LD35_9BACT|nr:hypothetical protein [Geomonas subterranea]QXE89567.1 hypothetical protein KP001_14100 [Geomonas subterranea]QXM08316.1 hypothetical protein KP002_15175 [Geomonas subterranea]